MKTSKTKTKVKVEYAIVHIRASFSNTIITCANRNGDVLYSMSAGKCGFSGSRKSTPYAAQVAAEKVRTFLNEMNVKKIDICFSGIGPGRDASARSLYSPNSSFVIFAMIDRTPIPHNGCRAKKKRRV